MPQDQLGEIRKAYIEVLVGNQPCSPAGTYQVTVGTSVRLNFLRRSGLAANPTLVRFLGNTTRLLEISNVTLMTPQGPGIITGDRYSQVVLETFDVGETEVVVTSNDHQAGMPAEVRYMIQVQDPG